MDRPATRSAVGVHQEQERGAATFEYVGIVVVLAALVATLLVALPSSASQLTDRVKTALCQLTGETGCETNQAGGGNNGNQTADPTRISGALDDLRQDLRSGDLDGARQVVESLSGTEIDALIAQMSDAELEEWVSQLDAWDDSQRRELWELFASKASRNTIDRLAQLTDELQPSFSRIGGEEAVDKPTSLRNTSHYGDLQHELFSDGASPTDVSQGALGDCWWIASMMAVAQADPQVIEEAITANPNGTYTVRLYDDDGNPVHVTVTPDMVLNPDGAPVFVDNGGQAQDSYELWPMVLEKALALYYGDFRDIEGGTADVGLSTLTGLPSSNTAPGTLSIQDLWNVLDEGGAIGLSSLAPPREGERIDNPLYDPGTRSFADLLHPGHAYYVSEVDVEAGTVTVVNPWGIAQFPPITLTYDEFVSAFRQVRTNEVTR